MRRNFFLALFLRLAAAVALSWATAYATNNLPLAALLALALSVAIAAWAQRTMAQSAAALARNNQTRPTWNAFDRTARILNAVDEAADRRLTASADSRRALETLLDSMPDSVVALDDAGRMQWSNAPMQRLLPGSAQRIGMALVQAIRDPDVLACVRTALDAGHATACRATSILPNLVFEVNVAPLPLGGAVVVMRDVTQIESMERVQRDFVANVSHELRTPLTSITGYVETLLGDVIPESETMARDFLATIQKNAARMNRLTEDLLVLSRFETGEHPLRSVRVRAAALVRETLDSLAVVIRDAQAKVTVAGAPETDLIADTDAVIRVLTNLIENAVKYGRVGAASAQVHIAFATAPDPAFIEFTIADSGPGIGSEHLGRLFERFYRADKARSRDNGGTGLGLAIARRLTESQGGRIWVESELGSGCTFHFTLPAAPVREAVAEPAIDTAPQRI